MGVGTAVGACYPKAMTRKDRFAGLILGTAVGDSLGLPAEGLSRRAIARRWKGPLRQRLVFGHGMVSDDTEHTVLAALAATRSGQDAEKFGLLLARNLRFWLLCLPSSVGFATARSLVRLWLGFSPARSGVFSAGNGPAMRSAILGALHAPSPTLTAAYVRASTHITHTDPKAEVAALAVARLAAWLFEADAHTPPPQSELVEILRSCAPAADAAWAGLVSKIDEGLGCGWTTEAFAEAIGCGKGVSGYAYHTVPVAVYSWARSASFREALEDAFRCGGDTDSVCAVVGALAGATYGPLEIPESWLTRLADWPLSRRQLQALADSLASGTPAQAAFPFARLAVRNVVFLGVVLAHAARRIVPL